MASYGTTTCYTTCSKCGEEVAWSYWYDRANGGTWGAEDTEHRAPDGTRCDLTDRDVEATIDGRTYDCEGGGDGPDD